jgi:predicted metalloprotease with PDZ domain
VYYGGWTSVLVLDRDVRFRSKNTKSLDDTMRWFYASFSRGDRPYTFSDVWAGINATSGLHYQQFLDRYVGGKELIPVTRYLDLGGFSAMLAARAAGATTSGQPDVALSGSLGIPTP